MFIQSVNLWVRQFILNVLNMRRSSDTNDEYQDKLTALLAIKAKYKRFIESDTILNRDFDRLINHLDDNHSPSMAYYEKIMSHLIAESAQIVVDDERISDESPTSIADDSDASQHRQEHRDLRRDLEACYIQQAQQADG